MGGISEGGQDNNHNMGVQDVSFGLRVSSNSDENLEYSFLGDISTGVT